MKALKILLIFTGVLFAALLAGYTWLGGFSTVTTSRGEIGPWEIVYSTHTGAYKNLSQSWSKFQKEWEAAGMKECDSLAIYLDPPGTPEDKLRSVIACRIDNLALAEKTALRGKLRNFVVPKSRAVMAKFPYKNPASYFIGPMKVYPEFQKVLAGEKITPPVGIETYGTMTNPAREMGYAMPTESTRADYQKLIDAF